MERKDEIEKLLMQISINRNRMELGIATAIMLLRPESHKYCDGIIDFGDHQTLYCGDLLHDLFSNENKKWFYVKSITYTAITASLTTCYELLKNQCKKWGNNYYELMREQIWFNYVRIIRNSLSHDYHIQYNKKDLKLLPIKFLKYELTEGMGGKPLSEDILPEKAALWAIRCMEVFVAKDLAGQFGLKVQLTK